LLCNMTVTLLWKCNELIVTQQELLRYYSNATTDLTCHNMNNLKISALYHLAIAFSSKKTNLICLIHRAHYIREDIQAGLAI
jgi:hypothetical protein